MSDPNGTDSDPSMDDILASIRKIISDDEARAQVGNSSLPPAPTVAGAMSERHPTTSRAGATANREDVLLLTDLIEEPKLETAAPRPAPPTPIPLPRIDPVNAGEMPQPMFDPHPTPMPMPTPAPASPPAFEQSLVGSSVAGAASSAFDRLNQVVEESKPAATAAAPAPVPGLALGNGGKTIEDLVKEMLRPMLKDWLERSLPPMVERLVEREIARLTRR